MAKKKDTKKATGTLPEPTANVTGRLDTILHFPAGWDQKPLADSDLHSIREYLRDNYGADDIETERHHSSNKIEGSTRKRRTAIFFAHTTTEGELIADGVSVPPRKGQLVTLPAGTTWKIRPTTQPREIIEFTF